MMDNENSPFSWFCQWLHQLTEWSDVRAECVWAVAKNRLDDSLRYDPCLVSVYGTELSVCHNLLVPVQWFEVWINKSISLRHNNTSFVQCCLWCDCSDIFSPERLIFNSLCWRFFRMSSLSISEQQNKASPSPWYSSNRITVWMA